MYCFAFFRPHIKSCLKWHQMRPPGFFRTNPGLADILGRTDLDFDIFFSIFWIPNFWISRSPDFQNLAWAGLGPWAAEASGGGCGCGRTLRSQPDPSPNAPRDQIRRKGPCCDNHQFWPRNKITSQNVAYFPWWANGPYSPVWVFKVVALKTRI